MWMPRFTCIQCHTSILWACVHSLLAYLLTCILWLLSHALFPWYVKLRENWICWWSRSVQYSAVCHLYTALSSTCPSVSQPRSLYVFWDLLGSCEWVAGDEAHFTVVTLSKLFNFLYIHSRYFYSTSSSPLLFRGSSDYSIDSTVSELTRQSATGNYEWRTCPRSLRGI